MVCRDSRDSRNLGIEGSARLHINFRLLNLPKKSRSAKMISRKDFRLLLAGLFLVGSGCQKDVETVSVPPAPKAEESKGVIDRSQFLEDIVISEIGLLGMPEGSPFSVDLVKQAIPGYDVEEAEDGSEGRIPPTEILNQWKISTVFWSSK